MEELRSPYELGGTFLKRVILMDALSKSTIDNPLDRFIKAYRNHGNTLLQLFEGESTKEKIFNYEQDLWSY